MIAVTEGMAGFAQTHQFFVIECSVFWLSIAEQKYTELKMQEENVFFHIEKVSSRW